MGNNAFIGNIALIKTCSDTTVYDEANDKLWTVVSSKSDVATQKEYKLSRGDILKLGRVQVKVRDLRIADSPNESDHAPQPQEEGPVDIKICDETPNEKEDVCRICFSNLNHRENPMVSACCCTGSMKFMHVECIKSWLNSKLVVTKTPRLSSYNWRSFECEICKTAYPLTLMHHGSKFDLVEYEKAPIGDFLILENINREKGIIRTIYVVTPGGGKAVYKVGRGHESDIRITDISVSRFHGILKCSKDGFIFEDNGSKFGTLIYEPEGVKLETGMKRVVQVGRTVIFATSSPQPLCGLNTQTELVVSDNPVSKISCKSLPSISSKVKSDNSKANPNSGDCNQMEDIPDDEDENMK